jgi:uncharacterized protein YlaN (UPF0358 family)
MSKIDDLYDEYNTRNDSYVARVRAANQLIQREDKIIALLKADDNDVTNVSKAIREDIDLYTMDFCPSFCDTLTFSNMILEYIISYYTMKYDCVNMSSSDLDMCKTLIALYEHIKENR